MNILEKYNKKNCWGFIIIWIGFIDKYTLSVLKYCKPKHYINSFQILYKTIHVKNT
jgi:hypothetical protein